MKGDIHYGALSVSMIKRRKGDSKILQRQPLKVERIVFTTHEGNVVVHDLLMDRVLRRIPKQYNSWEVESIKYVEGDKVGETQYHIDKFL